MNPEQMAAYLDRTLPEAEREQVDAHLTHCKRCRREVIEVQDLVDSRPRSRSRWFAAAGLAAAAISAIVLINVFDGAVEEPVLRAPAPGTVTESEPQVRIVRPGNGSAIPADSLVFVWEPIEPEALYRFTLTDAEGDVVFETDTSEATLAVPADAGLRRDAEYYWYVDALLSGGRSTTSGVFRFSTRP